jgi:hypothetical protein
MLYAKFAPYHEDPRVLEEILYSRFGKPSKKLPPRNGPAVSSVITPFVQRGIRLEQFSGLSLPFIEALLVQG